MRATTFAWCTAALVLLAACLCAAPLPAVAATEELLGNAEAIRPWIIDVRRTLHATPELMFEEFNTSELIRGWLDELNIPYRYPFAKTGIVAEIGSGEPIVVLRSDIDALPIQEPEAGLAYASRNSGRMHACGHDAHMAMLLGAAKILKARESSLPGTVRLVFQPAEEGGAGGDIMVKEGALKGASAAFGMHVMPHIASGHVATRGGTIMAGALSFEVTVKGRGGHAALPHLNIDPVVAAAAVISSLQTLVSRETSPLGSAVLSVTMLRAGDAYNVIPDTAMFAGTIRALSHDVMTTLQTRLEAMAAAVASGFGCSATVDWRLDIQPYYPPTVNDPEQAAFAQGVARKLLGTDAKVHDAEALMAGEDFAFLAQAAPSAFVFLGIRNATAGSVHNLHSPNFTMDESVLPVGAALHAALATEFLVKHSGGRHQEL